ncbi:replicative DNA helicase [Mycoplasma miroungirhinis]|uniref:Replicative DNA helicase n=1 Tax=Mycoplasma miroungirhinis TaxID=754516 RepID=A0A6M4JE95_9MOLU|nr:replicative DNA helicase [Mycoplasma miroungirhinis]QJR44417.1 replicative DNA helicase [Mycoplasma miroungirhinis]
MENFLSQDDKQNILDNEIPLMGLLITNSQVYKEIADSLNENLFYYKANKILYQSIVNLSEEYPNYDFQNLYNYLITNNLLNQNLGIDNYKKNDYLDFLVENVGYKDKAQDYINVLIPYAKKIQLNTFIENATNKLLKKENIDNIINNLQIDLINMDIASSKSHYETLDTVLEENKTLLLKRSKNELSTGLKFGFRKLDDLTLGFNPGDLVIIAARPSMGKTAFALNIAANVAKQRKNVLFFSLEMTNVQLVERIIGFESYTPLSDLKKGNIQEQWSVLENTFEQMKIWPLFLNDQSSLNIHELVSVCRRFKQTKTIDLLIVDYLQLINDTKNSGDNRQLEVSKISRSLKQLAKELNCPIIALSQLSRKVETREDKQPILSDLRESGTIEQDADSVIFLYRPEYYKRKPEQDKFTNPVEEESFGQVSTTHIIVAKNRNGAIGTIKLGFMASLNKFVDDEREDKYPW